MNKTTNNKQQTLRKALKRSNGQRAPPFFDESNAFPMMHMGSEPTEPAGCETEGDSFVDSPLML